MSRYFLNTLKKISAVKCSTAIGSSLVTLDEASHQMMLEISTALAEYNFTVKHLTQQKWSIIGVPHILQRDHCGQLLQDLLAQILTHQSSDGIDDAVSHILADRACKLAIKANRRLSIDEMNGLLNGSNTQFKSV